MGGVIEQETTVDPLDIVVREIDLRSSLAYTRHEFKLAFDMPAQGRINTTLILLDTIPLTDIEEHGFQRLLSAPGLVKIVVKP